jgi:hypothetical protein
MADENAFVNPLNLPFMTYDEPPLYQPMQYSAELAEFMDQDPAYTIHIWVSMRTMSSPMTAIGFQLLYNIYAADFRQFEPKHPRLKIDQFMELVNEHAQDIEWLDEGGVTIIKGLRWTTKDDLGQIKEEWFKKIDVAGTAEPIPKKPRTSQLGPTSAGGNRKDPLDADLYDVNKIDRDGKYQAWIKDCLVMTPQCTVDVGDLWLAFKAKFADPENTDLNTGPMNIKQLLRLVAECFSHVRFGGEVVYGITDLRWKQLPEGYTRSVSVHNIPEAFPEWLKEEAHKLLYLSKKRRAKAFLFMFFEKSQGMTISLRSMWKFYAIAFARSDDTHELLDQKEFLEVLKKTFKGTEAISVSENHTAVLDIGVRTEVTSADEYIALKRRYDFMRLEGIEPTDLRNRFNLKLMEDPWLALPSRRLSPEYPNQNSHSELKISDGSAAPGPFIQRLRRRAHDLPLPLGDEEPGFPGVSMKLEQRRYKRKIEAWKQASAALFDPDPAKRPTTERWAKASRAAARVTRIQKVDYTPPDLPSYLEGTTIQPSGPPSPPLPGVPGGVKSFVTADQAVELVKSGCKVEFRKRVN